MTNLTTHHRRDGEDDDKKPKAPADPDPGNYDPGDDIGTRIGEHHGKEGEQR